MAKRVMEALDFSIIEDATLKFIKDKIPSFTRYVWEKWQVNLRELKEDMRKLNQEERALNNLLESTYSWLNTGHKGSSEALAELKKRIGSAKEINSEVKELKKKTKALKAGIFQKSSEFERNISNLFGVYEKNLNDTERFIPQLVKDAEEMYKAQGGYEFREAASEEEKRRIIRETSGDKWKGGFIRRLFR